MPFDQASLSDGLQRALDASTRDTAPEPGSPPNVSRRSAEALAGAYDAYVMRNLLVLPFRLVSPPVPAALVQALRAPMLAGWSPGFVSYWAPVSFFGPGLIPVNPMDPSAVSSGAASLETQFAQFMSSPSMPSSRRAAAEQMAVILHSATVSLRFIATTLPPATVVTPTPIP